MELHPRAACFSPPHSEEFVGFKAITFPDRAQRHAWRRKEHPGPGGHLAEVARAHSYGPSSQEHYLQEEDPGAGTKSDIRQNWPKCICPFPAMQCLLRHSGASSKPTHRPLQVGRSRRTKATDQAF